MPLERGLYQTPLHASSASVHDPDLGESLRGRFVDVLLDDGHDVSRREGVEIELPIDGHFMQGTAP